MAIFRLHTTGALAPLNMSSLDATFGALLISTFVSLVLFGVAVHQTYVYFRSYPKDVCLLKVLVVAILVSEFIHSFLMTHICYYALVSNYDNPAALAGSVWSLQALPLVTGVVIVLVQGFYARRIYLFNKQYYLIIAVVGTLMMGTMGLIIASCVESIRGTKSNSWSFSTNLFAATLALVVLTDVTMTGTLVVILGRARTHIRRTNETIHSLIVYAIVATSLVSLITIPGLVLCLVRPQQLLYVAVTVVAIKLYSNSVLVFLNSRKYLSKGPTTFLEMTGLDRTPNFANFSASPVESPSEAKKIAF
ncbi:hypothetical protein LXA43DRAFT_173504 [Ganoderma leucocontextum]|nr:hypothetical protein LXA43DRAFT_173504 [Ganoderma leucocontextum]